MPLKRSGRRLTIWSDWQMSALRLRLGRICLKRSLPLREGQKALDGHLISHRKPSGNLRTNILARVVRSATNVSPDRSKALHAS